MVETPAPPQPAPPGPPVPGPEPMPQPTPPPGVHVQSVELLTRVSADPPPDIYCPEMPSTAARVHFSDGSTVVVPVEEP